MTTATREVGGGMNGRRGLAIVGSLAVGGLYWFAVSRLAGVAEPWDAAAYWRLWYPLSLGLAAVLGYALREDGWLAGAMLTVAQLPVMWLNGAIGPLVVVGIVFVCGLAVPAAAVALLSGLLTMRRRAIGRD